MQVDKELFKNKVVLVTGGTGTFGKAFIRYVLENCEPVKVICYSRGELAQVQMKRELISFDNVRFLIGDIRDRKRLSIALRGVDIVVHAAALKHVDLCEYNPFETVQTNVIGAQNIIEACNCPGNNVQKVLAVSTDKAVNPINLYGAAKLCSDKMFINSSVYNPQKTKYSVIRFGNFYRSNGSVVEYFERLRDEGKNIFPVTDVRMKRFFIPVTFAVERAIQALSVMLGGEIFVPVMAELAITELVESICPGGQIEEVGVRPGEKLQEELFAKDEERYTIEKDGLYVTKYS